METNIDIETIRNKMATTTGDERDFYESLYYDYYFAAKEMQYDLLSEMNQN